MAQRRQGAGQASMLDTGELDTQPFFKTKRAAAVLKHAILSDYVVPFSAKTGHHSQDNRVVIVDGYAGTGRYDDGSPGSPILLAEAARLPGLAGRTVECHFVEKDPTSYSKLCRVLTEEDAAGGRIIWKARQGTVEDHLDELLDRADGLPLLLFLDPFGRGLPFDTITKIFADRPAGQGTPATEVLLRFDANLIRRTRGVLHSPKDFPAKAGQLRTLDRASGGSWWQDEDDPNLDNEGYVSWFEQRLLHRLCAAADCSGWSTDVRNKPENQAAYLMLFLTRHRAGFETFGDSLSRAQEKWRRFVFDEALASAQASGQTVLLDADPDTWFKDVEARLAAGWQDRIEANIRTLLQQQEHFVIRDKFGEVFAGVHGQVRIKHLRAVLRKLNKAAITSSDSVGEDLYGKLVVRADGARP